MKVTSLSDRQDGSHLGDDSVDLTTCERGFDSYFPEPRWFIDCSLRNPTGGLSISSMFGSWTLYRDVVGGEDDSVETERVSGVRTLVSDSLSKYPMRIEWTGIRRFDGCTFRTRILCRDVRRGPIVRGSD